MAAGAINPERQWPHFKRCPQQTLMASKEGATCSSPAAQEREASLQNKRSLWLQPCSACCLDFKVNHQDACTSLQIPELCIQCQSPVASKATEVSLTDGWHTPNSSCFHTWLQHLSDIPLKYFSIPNQYKKMLTNLTNKVSGVFRALKQLSTRSEKR